MKNLFFPMCLIFLAACQQKKINTGPIMNGDVAIAHTVSGENDTAIVFVHGWCINQTYWDNQREQFSKHFKVVTLDLGGHGQSTTNRNSWTVGDFGNDVITVINSLDLEKVILIGHSMGGNIILDVAHKIPEKIIGFVGIDNFKDESKSFTREQQAQIDTFMNALRTNFDATASAYSYGALFPPQYEDSGSMKRVIHDIQQTDSVVAIAALESLMKESLKEGELLSGLQVPVYLVVSDYTPINEEPLAQYCKKGYAIKTVHGTGHYPMIEKPTEFNQLLAEIILSIQFGMN